MRRSEVIGRYRLSPERIEWLVNKFENELRRNTNRNFPLSPETKETMRDFYTIAGFPKVVGAIDGTLIPIKAPSKEHLYVCHKGYHAINVMAVCNAQMKFTNLVAKWHGAVHDSAVFNASSLQQHMQSRQREGWLLGDRGYALQPYLMTPLNPEKISTLGEENYQRSHTKTKNIIERSFGVLKQRFCCLDFSGGVIQFSPDRCCNIIVTTVVLHNMCIVDNTPLPAGLGAIEVGENNEGFLPLHDYHKATKFN